MKQFLLIVLLFLTVCLSGKAQSLQETRKLFNDGEYLKAKPGVEKLIKASPANANYNYWYGVCLYETGEKEAAEKPLKTAASKKVAEANIHLGHLYYEQCLFEASVDAYESYIVAIQKQKNSSEKEEAVEPFLARSKRAARLLKYTEDVQIIDSLIVDQEDFLDHYSLSEESGFLTAREEQKEAIYTNQLQNKRYYAKTDSNGVYALYTQSKLMDKWGDEKKLSEEVNTPEDNSFPFVMTDGVTIYFASKGGESIGGYDLYITRYNNNTDTYLAPEQLGMPFNSIYNDFMLAIDELNGIGYFASDRFQEEGKVIIYTFIPNEGKKRVESDDETVLRNRALITSIRDSWKEGQDYEALLRNARKNIGGSSKNTQKDFTFVINDNIVYHTLSEFESDAAKSLFTELQEMKKILDQINKSLDANRAKYSKSPASERASLTGTLQKEENQQESLVKAYRELEVKVRNTEIKHLRQQQQ